MGVVPHLCRETKMNNDTIVGSRRPKFLKPGEKYHWVRETEWEREWEAEGLLPKRWAVASEPVAVETYNPSFVWDPVTNWIRKVDEK